MMHRSIGLLALLLAASMSAHAAQPDPLLTGPAAYGDWRSDAPGKRRLIRPSDLPAPYASPSSSNGPHRASLPQEPTLRAPAGFVVSLWTRGLTGPRTIKSAPNGDVFVAETGAGVIKVLRPTADGAASEPPVVFARDLDEPFGMAFAPRGDQGEGGDASRWLYVATTSEVFRFPYRDGDRLASGPPQKIADLGISQGGHSTRDLVFSRDGTKFFVSVGSQSNAAEDMPRVPVAAIPKDLPKGASWEDETRRADVLEFDKDGSHSRVYATGIRNCVGLALAPTGDDLYCSTNERDGLGDDLPPDYVTRVGVGQFFGWPWFYIGNHEDPRHAGERPDLASSVTVPNVLLQPHSAPLAIAFYDPPKSAPSAFPEDYAGNAFVALHGSWNRASRTGYKVVRIPMDQGRPTGAYEDFLVGFVTANGGVWGRPVGVASAKDGSLLVSDDQSGTIWRVAPTK